MVDPGIFLFFQPADWIKDDPGIFLFLCLFSALRNLGQPGLAAVDLLYGALKGIQGNDQPGY